MTEPGPVAKLERNAVGLTDVLFQSITSMAPGAAIAASIPLGAAFAGGALPLSVFIAFIGMLFTAVSIGQLAKHIPAAGSVATYNAVGLAPWVGFLVGWAYAAVEVLIVPLVMLQLGYTVAGEWNTEQSSFPISLWWIFTVAGTLLICFLVYRGVKTSTRTGVVLGFIEIIVFLAPVDRAGDQGGEPQHAVGLHAALREREGYKGMTGVIAGAVGALLAFSGFEAAAPLAEETKNPRKNVPRAVILSTILIGALYIFTTYAATVYYGPEKFSGFAAYANGVPWDGLARSVSMVFWALVLFAIINSTLANANAGANVFTRTAYAFGRVGAFPRWFADLHPKYKSPRVGLLVELHPEPGRRPGARLQVHAAGRVRHHRHGARRDRRAGVHRHQHRLHRVLRPAPQGRAALGAAHHRADHRGPAPDPRLLQRRRHHRHPGAVVHLGADARRTSTRRT